MGTKQAATHSASQLRRAVSALVLQDNRLRPWLDGPLPALGAPQAPTLSDPRPARTAFESMCRIVVSQQLSGKVATTIWLRLVAALGGQLVPLAVAVAPLLQLRAVGLSQQKATYLHNIATFFADKPVGFAAWYRRDDAEMTQQLLSIKGVGPWSVDMFRMFSLGRLDVLPVGDLGVKLGMMKYFGKDALTPHEMVALADRWRPYRSLGAWCMWRVLADKGH